MLSQVNWSNPYADREGHWLKGNLHTHTSPASSCGTVPLETVLDLYAELKYDFLSISDHMTYVEARDDRFITIPGVEWNPADWMGHTGVYSLDSKVVESVVPFDEHPDMLESLKDADALVILNHPNWQLVPHYRRERLLELSNYHGIEIYNAVIEVLDGYSISTDKWDYLLANGRRVLGFASDDSHRESQIGQAWITVRASERSAVCIMDAIRRGNFYCSSGVNITDIARHGSVIDVETENAEEIDVRGDGGVRFHRALGNRMSFDTQELQADYVRITAYGPGSTMAWTQPFFLK